MTLVVIPFARTGVIRDKREASPDANPNNSPSAIRTFINNHLPMIPSLSLPFQASTAPPPKIIDVILKSTTLPPVMTVTKIVIPVKNGNIQDTQKLKTNDLVIATPIPATNGASIIKTEGISKGDEMSTVVTKQPPLILQETVVTKAPTVFAEKEQIIVQEVSSTQSSLVVTDSNDGLTKEDKRKEVVCNIEDGNCRDASKTPDNERRNEVVNKVPVTSTVVSSPVVVVPVEVNTKVPAKTTEEPVVIIRESDRISDINYPIEEPVKQENKGNSSKNSDTSIPVVSTVQQIKVTSDPLVVKEVKIAEKSTTALPQHSTRIPVFITEPVVTKPSTAPPKTKKVIYDVVVVKEVETTPLPIVVKQKPHLDTAAPVVIMKHKVVEKEPVNQCCYVPNTSSQVLYFKPTLYRPSYWYHFRLGQWIHYFG
jgi:hypothetical protein